MDSTAPAIEQQFEVYTGTLQVLEIIGLIFLLAIVSETVFDYFFGRRKKLGETLANFSIGIITILLERTAYSLIFIVGLLIAAEFTSLQIPHTWWTWVLAVIVADFTYYWMHRWEHEVRIFWAHHSVHHSSPEFNLTTALRIAWVDAVIEWIFFIPMILIGFDVVQTIIALSIVVAYQTLIHTEKVGKLGWLDKVLNTPSVHRVHHGKNPQYIDKNYGGILIIWDRLFGTYEPEVEKVIYGITTPPNSNNPFIINFYEYWRIGKDIRRSKKWTHAFGYLFKGPGWRPKK